MFDASKLHVTFADDVRPDGPVIPRCYTLTHSDLTGDLFLSIGTEHDRRALRTLQVRLERDEVLGEWVHQDGADRLELSMMAQGGLPLFGTGAMRCNIFRHYRAMTLGAMRHGDQALVASHPELDEAPVIAQFRWRDGHIEREQWRCWGDWR